MIPPLPTGRTDPPPDAELLRSLGRLVRGLSALFWSLPVALIVCIQTAKMDTLRNLNILPPVIVTGWPLYGLWQLGCFQKQERIWTKALDGAKQLALINLGLSPFLFWYSVRPDETFYLAVVGILAVSALLFLRSLNHVLYRLSTMLPDEALRIETSQFTAMNRRILAAILVSGIFFTVLLRLPVDVPIFFQPFVAYGTGVLWLLLFLALLPLAMTMALTWKIKEVIMDSVFSAGR